MATVSKNVPERDGFELANKKQTALKSKAVTRWREVEMRNLFEALEAVDHPQYRAYRLSRELADRFHTDWIPSGLNEVEYGNFTRVHRNPIIKDRRSLIESQMPLAEMNSKRCNHLPTLERKSVANLIKIRNKNDLGVGQVSLKKSSHPNRCERCSKDIPHRGYCVSVMEKHGRDKAWCVRCFRCTDCGETPADLIYFWYQDAPYCLRHYGEKFRPRCDTCDELIFEDEYTKAMKKNYHLDHFICHQCRTCLTDSKFVVKNNECLCLPCYDDKYAQECHKCHHKIKCKDHGLSFKQQYWHDTCFQCSSCNQRLNGMPFAMREEELFCAQCYESKVALRCHSCREIFAPGTKTFEFREKRWHEKCFVCVKCHAFIGTESFIPVEGDSPMCLKCHARTVLPQCSKCSEPITCGGVSYRGETWHSQCFVCGFCKGELAGKKFTIRDETPYCAHCYGEHFAKRCGICSRPISGFHGDQFVTFNDCHYHSTCFNCNRCTANLIKSGFVFINDHFMCPECAQNEKTKPQIQPHINQHQQQPQQQQQQQHQTSRRRPSGNLRA